jgi:hypothetical protein
MQRGRRRQALEAEHGVVGAAADRHDLDHAIGRQPDLVGRPVAAPVRREARGLAGDVLEVLDDDVRLAHADRADRLVVLRREDERGGRRSRDRRRRPSPGHTRRPPCDQSSRRLKIARPSSTPSRSAFGEGGARAAPGRRRTRSATSTRRRRPPAGRTGGPAVVLLDPRPDGHVARLAFDEDRSLAVIAAAGPHAQHARVAG